MPMACAMPDEFVRHKALDALGDLALAGAPLLATYRSVRGGHKLNHAVLSALMSDPVGLDDRRSRDAGPPDARWCGCCRRYGGGLRTGRFLSGSACWFTGCHSQVSGLSVRNADKGPCRLTFCHIPG